MGNMPKSPNTIHFSLPSQQIEKLKNLAVNGESVGLVVKRIVLEALGSPIDKPIDKNRLDFLESRIESLEVKLESLQGIGATIDNSMDSKASKTDLAENLTQSDRALKLQQKFIVASLNAQKQIEKFWSGRDWSEDLSKAKIFESERGATASVKSLKSKGYKNVAFNSCDRLYEMLSDEKKALAVRYWLS